MVNTFSDIRSKYCSIQVERNQAFLAKKAQIARSMSERMTGLLGRQSLDEGEGLILPSCQSIHMFFMQFAIDAVFIDYEGSVIRIYASLPPWRMTSFTWGASAVIELPSGVVAKVGLKVHDRLIFKE